MLAMSLHRDPEEALACAVAAIYNAKYERKSAVDMIPICYLYAATNPTW